MKARSARTLLAMGLERWDVFELVADRYPSTTLNLRRARMADCCEYGIRRVVRELVAAGHIADERGTMSVEQVRALLARLDSLGVTPQEYSAHRDFLLERVWVWRTMRYALADRLLRQELQVVKALRGQPEPDWDRLARQRWAAGRLSDSLVKELQEEGVNQ